MKLVGYARLMRREVFMVNRRRPRSEERRRIDHLDSRQCRTLKRNVNRLEGNLAQ